MLDDPDDLEARGGMQLGACFAGLAIENSMLGATHALANPLTTRYGIVHGQAIGLMLPHVIRFNGGGSAIPGIATCSKAPAGGNGFPAAEQGPPAWPISWPNWPHMPDLPGRLSECGVEPTSFRKWPPRPPNSGPAGSIRVGLERRSCWRCIEAAF